jgi:hypothetical protein
MSYWTEVLFDWRGAAPDPARIEPVILQAIGSLGLHHSLQADMLTLFDLDRDPAKPVLIPLDGPAIITLIEAVLPLCPSVGLIVRGTGEVEGDHWVRRYRGRLLVSSKGAAPLTHEAPATDSASGRMAALEIIKLDRLIAKPDGQANQSSNISDMDTTAAMVRRTALLARYPVLNGTGLLTEAVGASPYGTLAPWVKPMPLSLARLIAGGGPFAPSRLLRQFLDLPSAHSAAEIAAWRASVFDRISDVAQQSVSFTFEPQLAGVNIGLRYENGQLCLAVAEGEAVFGPGDLASLAAIQNLPMRMSGRGIPKIIEVHACLFVPRSALSAALRSHALQALRALRNRQAAVELKCLAHEMAYSSEPVANTHFETMQCLDRWGFEVSSRLAISEEAVREDRAFHQLSQDRASMEFPVVGGIYRLNYFHLRKRLASGARPLPWAVARPFRLADL